jgi:hypothetical protein
MRGFADMRTWGQFAIDDGFGDLAQDPFSEGFADFFAFVLILRRHCVDPYEEYTDLYGSIC